MNMNTRQPHHMLRPSNLLLVATTAAALAFAGSAGAQYKAVGDDGIAASPKVRQMLDERKAGKAITSIAAPAMACPKCADVPTTQASRVLKGAEIATGVEQVAYTHACPGCETKWTVVGEGKAKHSVATHKCTADVPNPSSCCASN